MYLFPKCCPDCILKILHSCDQTFEIKLTFIAGSMTSLDGNGAFHLSFSAMIFLPPGNVSKNGISDAHQNILLRVLIYHGYHVLKFALVFLAEKQKQKTLHKTMWLLWVIHQPTYISLFHSLITVGHGGWHYARCD